MDGQGTQPIAHFSSTISAFGSKPGILHHSGNQEHSPFRRHFHKIWNFEIIMWLNAIVRISCSNVMKYKVEAQISIIVMFNFRKFTHWKFHNNCCKNPGPRAHIRIGRLSIPWKNTIKYLGCHLDPRMTLKDQINKNIKNPLCEGN